MNYFTFGRLNCHLIVQEVIGEQEVLFSCSNVKGLDQRFSLSATSLKGNVRPAGLIRPTVTCCPTRKVVNTAQTTFLKKSSFEFLFINKHKHIEYLRVFYSVCPLLPESHFLESWPLEWTTARLVSNSRNLMAKFLNKSFLNTRTLLKNWKKLPDWLLKKLKKLNDNPEP